MGSGRYRTILAAATLFALTGCAATSQEVLQQLGSQYVGKSSDNLVKDFGPPASTFKLQSGEQSMIWQLDAVTNIRGDSDRATARTRYCKLSVIADPKGTVTGLQTEDSNSMYGSICAQRLGIQRQT